MLEDISNETYGNENLLQEQLRLQARRQRLIDQAKEAQRQAGINSQGRMIGNTYVKAPKLAAFVPIVQQLAAHVEDRAYDEQNRALNSRITKAQADHLRAYPGPDADTKAALEWSMKGAQIPGMQPVMEKFLQDRLVAAPEREAARQSKAEQAAAALAEKKERQERELEYRRESDRIRSEDRRYQTDQMTGLRRDLAGAMAARGGSGKTDPVPWNSSGGSVPEGLTWKTVKNPLAKNIKSSVDDQGNFWVIHTPTMEVQNLGKLGKQAAGITNDGVKQQENRSNASKALDQLDEAERLLPEATGSLGGQLRDKVYGAAGIASTGAQAASQLDVLANSIVAGIPRMAGQVSDADLKFLQKQGGDLANRELPVAARLAALKQVRRIMQKAAAAPPAGPSIREAVEEAAKQQGSKSIDDLLNKYK